MPVGRAIVSATQRLWTTPAAARLTWTPGVVLAHVLQVERSWLFAHYDYERPGDEAERYSDAVAQPIPGPGPGGLHRGRRSSTGWSCWSTAACWPRPETEMLVDAVLDWIERRPGRAVTVADIGTGSGAIALAVQQVSGLFVYATDVNQEALTVAASTSPAPRPGRAAARRSVGLAAGEGRHHRRQPHPQRWPRLAGRCSDYEAEAGAGSRTGGLGLIERLLAQLPAYLKPSGAAFLEWNTTSLRHCTGVGGAPAAGRA